MFINLAQQIGICGAKAFPRGEGAPVRTLGRMRNGDIFHLQLQLVKKVKTIDYNHLNLVHSTLQHLAVPHPSRLRRSTFPPGEGFWRRKHQCVKSPFYKVLKR